MKPTFYLGPNILASALLLCGCNSSSPAVPDAAAAPPTISAPAPTPASPTTPPPAFPAAGDPSPAHPTAVPPSAPSDPTPAQLAVEAQLPTLDRSESIAGPDTDRNGVRDDIDTYLLQRFPDQTQRAAAIQMAKAIQSAVLAGGSSADASAAASHQIFNAVNCLGDRFDGMEGANSHGAVLREIESITTNTKARLLAYLAYNKSRNGTASSFPQGDTCE